MTAEAVPAVPTVRVPQRSVGTELRAIKIVWQRDLIRFSSDKLRIVTSLVQPALLLFVLGTGLSQLTKAGTDGLNLRTFFYPGILGMAVMFTAVLSAASVVWDREFGFLREMLVAPVRRSSIVIGKCLGGATVAAAQGLLILAMAGLAGVPYAPTLVLGVFGLQLLLSFMLSAFALVVAARVNEMQTFMALTQLLVLPLFFLSGAMYPVTGQPAWLSVLNRVDPLTYAIDPMRRVVFDHLNLSGATRMRLDPGVTWGGWHVPALLEAALVLVLGLGLLGIAVAEFRRSD
ncbi:MAG TPA: ABC transporter permease [Jatrophihabitantaceae bacterium]|jgi:ABC-2 type transport system permease protein